MGVSKNHQVDGIGQETEGKKWAIAGIAIHAPLRPVTTKPEDRGSDNERDESCSTTPTAKESRIPEKFPCPLAPRKRRPSPICHYKGAREFFTPPDLETVFMRHVERAN